MGKFAVLPPTMLIKTRQEAEVALAQLRVGKGGKRSRVVAVDTETTGLSRQRDYALIMSLSTGPNRYAIWPEAFSYFTEYLEDPELQLLMWNANFDTWMLRNAGIDIYRNCGRTDYRVFDAMIMHALDYDDRPHTLKYAAKEMLGIVMVDFKTTFGAQMRTRSLHEIFLDPKNEPVVANYAGLDAYATFALAIALQKKLLATNTGVEEYPTLWDYYRHTEVPFTRVLFECESNGIGLDKDRLIAIAPDLDRKMIAIMRWFVKKTKKVGINLNSNPQMIELFFGDLGYRPPSYTDKGAPQLAQKWLERIASDGCVYADKLLAYRDLKKKQSTYVRGLLKLEHRGRIHTTYKQAGARTGRLSCVSGSTLLPTTRGTFRFDDYTPHAGDMVRTHTGALKPVLRKIYKGQDPMFRVSLDTGATIECTADHRILTTSGWERVGNLAPGAAVRTYSGHLETLYGEPGEHPARPGRVPVGRQAHNAGSGRPTLNDRTKCPVCSQQPLVRRDGPSGEGFEVLPLEAGCGQPHAGEDRRGPSQLDREVRGRTWVSNAEGRREEILRPPGRDGRDAGNPGKYAAAQFGSAPPRRRPKEQRPGQPLPNDEGGTRTSSHAGATGCVVAITPLGEQGVWDIEVAEDHSYVAQGFYHHNSNSPNLQNQPGYIRFAYIAGEEKVLIARDFSQLEMRIVAHFSQEPNLIRAIRSGQDVHCSCAALMFKIPYDAIMAARARDDEIDLAKKAGLPYEPLTDFEKECLLARKAA